jgi:hypothetical protein
VFALSSGRYFKWMAHDDIHQPDFLMRCVEILDRDPSVVLAFTQARTINHEGHSIRAKWGISPALGSHDPYTRFSESLSPPRDPIPLPIFGLIRAEVLSRTRLYRSYPDCDRALLAELSLYGRLSEIPEALFLQRDHPDRAGPKLSKDPYAAGAFWKSKNEKKPILLPHWKIFAGYLFALNNSDLPWKEKGRCATALGKWVRGHGGLLVKDVILCLERIPLIGSFITVLNKEFARLAWVKRVQSAIRKIDSLTPREAVVILVDDGAFGIDRIHGRRIFAFIENDGVYWGAPADDKQAIQELERLRATSDFMIFGWPAFWWFDYYLEFKEYMFASFACIATDRNMIVFDLKARKLSG